MSFEELARPDILALRAYETTVEVNGALRLHANESPWSNTASPGSLNRYPDIRPSQLHSRLAARFDVATDKLLATRGSSEAIDLLIRSFCRAGQDNIVITPPTFVMYRFYADIQGAEIISCPLSDNEDFRFDTDAVAACCTPRTKLVFVCSPNNPSGNLVPQAEIVRLLEIRRDKSIIVVDEAYIEFSDAASMAELVSDYDNLVVLRTLSKALGLAGARCGAVIGNAALIKILNGVLPPYAMPTPVIDCVMRALSSANASASRIEQIIAERERLAARLTNIPRVNKVWPSQANFLLVRFHDLQAVKSRLERDRILIRDFDDKAGLEGCARITVGKPDENERLLAALTD